MNRPPTVAIVIYVLVCFALTGITRSEDKPQLADEALRFVGEFHYTGKYCNECHVQTPKEGGDTFLKFGGDYDRLCRCHLEIPGSYIHPVDLQPSDAKRVKIPDDLPLQGGKLTCLTCHDIYHQCQERVVDKYSLRGAPYTRRSDFCFKCHDEKEYMMLDPHKQLDPDGEVIVEKCLYCHEEKPDEKQANYEDLKFIGHIEILCQRCHVIRGNHAGNFDHMVKPSPEGLRKMKEMEEKFDIVLPLDADGKMTCITCHNPHERGVIPPDRAGAKGADSKFRHRLPDRICIECHQM
jgi:hypothetical protein